MERFAPKSESAQPSAQGLDFEMDLPPPYERPRVGLGPRLRLGRRALTDASRVRIATISGFPGRKVKVVRVTEAGRARVLERAERSNKERQDSRTLAILDAAAKKAS